ncbi:MAG: type I restriction endonuclease [Eubacteriales bacterium]
MAIATREIDFENTIEAHLLSTGYTKGDPHDFDRSAGLDTAKLFQFLKDSQPNEWAKLAQKHGSQVEENFLKRLTKEMDTRGVLHLLRHGVVDAPAKFALCYFPPASKMNQTVVELYAKNILSITRQVRYSQKNQNSIDVVLFVNGIPFATLELKNQMTGQTVLDAIEQYKNDRDHREVLLGFNRRCLVHFAVDTDEVWMTTELKGKDTYFLPFNKGNNGGKGNPVNPDGGCRTSYLWEIVLQKDSVLDIIQRFIHLDQDKRHGGKSKRLIFPRYHQLDVVRLLIKDVKEHGTGKNYLIQHSAGSGKSNSIAWLAHHLSNLHDKDDKVIFNSTIVVTDRQVLDKQLQDTIYQFEHVDGVVTKVDQHSTQLADALNKGRKIIITTLQKFPFILQNVNDLSGKRFAVIVDEAHSSQTGESSRKLKAVLGDTQNEEEQLRKIALEEAQEETNRADYEDELAKEMATHGKLSNLSFFGFTATPKPKTLEMFGVLDQGGIPRAFHVYSMKQAIEENFIHDVLKHYVTYEVYFKIGKTIAEDPRYEKSKANKALGKFVSLHPYHLAQKTQIIVEHFRTVTQTKIGGRGKAMVVTGSRLHAVRYYNAFKSYIKKMGYENELGILIAFSGMVDDEGNLYTEAGMNKISEKELPDKFSTDDYQVLLVADKYQTGFDEPLLHTMFVDKPLSGVKAVQTLSRVNRTCNGKIDTMILDFVNSAEEIREAFEPFYTQTSIEETTDCNLVYDLKTKLEEYRVTRESEIEAFAKVYFKPTKKQGYMDFSTLNKHVDPAIDRYKGLEDHEKGEFASSLVKFIRMYAFLSNIVKLDDGDMHKFFAYAKFMANKLPKGIQSPQLYLDDEVSLQFYRQQKIFEGSIELEGDVALKNKVHAGTPKPEEEESFLSVLLEKLNDRFGTAFTEEDMLVVQQLFLDMTNNDDLRAKAKSNSEERFHHPCDQLFLDIVIDRMSQNSDFFGRILDDSSFSEMVKEILFSSVYQWFKKNPENPN